MGFWQALILGIVQGATEFVPISSSGHLVLVPWLLGWPKPALVFDTTLHLGTLAAVLLFFWRDCWSLLIAWLKDIKGFFSRTNQESDPKARVAWGILLATVPAALLGYLFEDRIEVLFGAPVAVGVFLLITGAILTWSERAGSQRRELGAIGWRDALWIGLAQAGAILPGISRSGATIAAGLASGFRREEAARFSFLLSIPIILGTGFFKLIELGRAEAQGSLSQAIGNLLVGFLAAAFSGYFCIRFLLAFLRRGRLYAFAIYCISIGLAVLVLSLLGMGA